MKVVWIIGILLVTVAACKKPENRTCWKFTGKEAEREIPLAEFDRMRLNPHLAYVLIQDSLDKVVIKGGENLVNLVDCTVSDKLLEITNKNRCAFLRNAKKELLVEIHFTTVINIHYEGTEYLRSVGTIHSDYFTLMVRDGAGPVDLTMDSEHIDADISHGWGDYTLHGTTASARIGARSNGYCDVYDLTITDSVYVASDSPGNIKVRANGIPMAGFIKSSGNILYKGTPSSIAIVRSGTGEVKNSN